jgi:streptomycin 6-kinase
VTTADVTVPEELRNTVRRWFGERGRQWLADLPATAAALAQRWELWLGEPYLGGTHSLVLRATTGFGTPVVLKLPFRDDENYAEAAALRCYDGDGAVRLLAHDEQSGALLLERAEPGSPLSRHRNRSAAIAIACGLLRRLRRPAPADEFPSVAVLASRWAQELPARQRRHRLPAADPAVGEAADIAAEYAERPDGLPLLVNRDAHLGNVVRAQRGRWLLIDPKPVLGEAAFEAAHPVLQTVLGSASIADVDAAAIARAITSWSIGLGVDPARVRGWALIRAVDNALWSVAVGTSPDLDLALIGALSPAAGPPRGRASQAVDDRLSDVVAQNPQVVDRQVDRGLPGRADHPVA